MSVPPVETEGATLTLASTVTLVFKGIWLIANPLLRKDLQAIKSKLDQLQYYSTSLAPSTNDTDQRVLIFLAFI
jgi:hypothetical protein